jgi:hypothetical protein
MLSQLQVFVNVNNSKLLCRQCQNPPETSELLTQPMVDKSLPLLSLYTGHAFVFSDRPWGPPTLGPTHPPVLLDLFPGGKAVGAWSWLPTPSGAEVKERLQVYLYSPSGPLCPVLGELFCFTVFFVNALPEHILKFKRSNKNKVTIFTLRSYKAGFKTAHQIFVNNK